MSNYIKIIKKKIEKKIYLYVISPLIFEKKNPQKKGTFFKKKKDFLLFFMFY